MGRKHKKKKGKVNVQTSNPNINDGHDHEEVPHEESSGSINIIHVVHGHISEEDQLERNIYEMLKLEYNMAHNILQSCRYDSSTARIMLLAGGCILGEGQYMFGNIVRSSVKYIERYLRDVNGHYVLDEAPIYENLHDLIMFMIEALVSFAEKFCRPDQEEATPPPPPPPRLELLRLIFEWRSIDMKGLSAALEGGDRRHDDYNSSVSTNAAAKFDGFLRANIEAFEDLPRTQKIDGGETKQLPAAEELDDDDDDDEEELGWSNLKCLEGLPEGLIDDEDWVRKSCDIEDKDGVIRQLNKAVECLKAQVKEGKEWNERKEREANDAENRLELIKNAVRQEKRKVKELKKAMNDHVAVYVPKMMTADADLVKLVKQLGDAEGRIKDLESQNSRLRADVNAFKLQEAESNMKLKQARKGEKEWLRKTRRCDAEMTKLQQETQEEREKVLELTQALDTVGEAQNVLKLRVKQAVDERQKANDIYLEEKRSLRLIQQDNGKQRLASLEQELKMEEERLIDEKLKLMDELNTLKLSSVLLSDHDQGPSAAPEGSSSEPVLGEAAAAAAGSSQANDNSRLCIKCNKKEVCMVFLPCAHEVVCFNCSKWLGENCPYCQVPIQEKIRVYGPASS